jgi:hypothetical protein
MMAFLDCHAGSTTFLDRRAGTDPNVGLRKLHLAGTGWCSSERQQDGGRCGHGEQSASHERLLF